MSNKRYYWLKLKEDFFKDKAIKKLRKIAGGDTYTIIYLKLMLRSMESEGKLYFDGLEDTFCEELALDIDENAENVKVTVMYLIKCGLLKEVNEQEIEITRINEMVGSETNKAELMRKKRAKDKLLNTQKVTMLPQKVTSLPDVTKSLPRYRYRERDREKNKDIEKESKKESTSSVKKTTTKETFNELIDNYTDNEQLRNELKEHLKTRKAKKATLTNHAIELSLKKLDSITTNDNEKILIVQNAIENGWTTFYPLRKIINNQTSTNYSSYDIDEYEKYSIFDNC